MLLIELNDGDFKMESKIFAVPQSIMQGAGHEVGAGRPRVDVTGPLPTANLELETSFSSGAGT